MEWRGQMHEAVANVRELTGFDLSAILAVLGSLISLSILYTRFSSGRTSTSGSLSSNDPPSLPYWLPLLGHLPQWLIDFDGTLQNTRNAFGTGISTLRLGRESHHIVSSWRIARDLENSPKADLSDENAKKRLWRNVFGVPKGQLGLYQEMVTAIQIPVKFHLDAELKQAHLQRKPALMRRLEGNLPDLVTFNASLIDQEPWEKVSAVKVSEDQKVAEVSLLPLVFLFLTHVTTNTFISESLLSDQDHLEVGPLLLAFTQSYATLMTGLPRWVPHPTLPGAHITRRKLLGHLDAVLDITEDKELQNDLLEARGRMLEDHKAPRAVRTIELLRLLHGLNAPHVLAFWMLLHIVSDASLLAQVRKEASFAVKIVQEKPVMGFTVPPRVKIDNSTLLGPKTSMLKSCWLEAARLYSRGQDSWIATSDLELNGEGGGVFKADEKWKIRKGEWIDTPYWHANTDGTVWEDPNKWNPQRHVRSADDDVLDDTKVFNGPGLLGMDEAVAPARLFALVFVATAVLLYDFEVDGSKAIPTANFAAGVALPAGDVRVGVRKRVSA